VHSREHLLVSPDHGVNDDTPKFDDLLLIHLKAWPHFAEHLIPPVFRLHSQVPAKLAERQCLVHLLHGPIGLIEEWLRISHNPFRNDSHVYVPPSKCSERVSISGKSKADTLRVGFMPRTVIVFGRYRRDYRRGFAAADRTAAGSGPPAQANRALDASACRFFEMVRGTVQVG
jgi:hypothetical protein